MDSVEHQDLLKQLTFINLEVQHMGAEFDRLTASIAALDSKVTEIETYIKDNPGNVGGATPAQLVEFADKIDADVTRLTAAMDGTVTPPVTDTDTDVSETQAEKDAREAAEAEAKKLADEAANQPKFNP